MSDDELPIRLPQGGLVLYKESEWVRRTDASLVLDTRKVGNVLEVEWENHWSRGSELVGNWKPGALPKDIEDDDGHRFFRRSERKGTDSTRFPPGRYGITFELQKSPGTLDWVTSRFVRSHRRGALLFEGCVQFLLDVPAPHEDYLADADARLALLDRAARGIESWKVIDGYRKGKRSPEELIREAVEARRLELGREAALREVDVEEAITAVRRDTTARERLVIAAKEQGLSESELEDLLDRVFGRDATKA